MEFVNNLRQKAHQRQQSDNDRSKAVRYAIMQLNSEGVEIDGILAIFLKGGKIYVMEGGLQDDFEAQAMIQRAQYLINRDGLVK